MRLSLLELLALLHAVKSVTASDMKNYDDPRETKAMFRVEDKLQAEITKREMKGETVK